MESKDIEHSERLHAYVEERAFGRDEVLRRVEDATSALGGIAIMQTGGVPGRVPRAAGEAQRREARARGGHLHRLRRDPHRPRPARGRHAAVPRARRGVGRHGAGERRGRRSGRQGRDTGRPGARGAPGDARRAHVRLRLPRRRQGELPRVLRGDRAAPQRGRPARHRQRAEGRPGDRARRRLHRAVARLNDRVADDVRVESVLLPLADGLTLVRRK